MADSNSESVETLICHLYLIVTTALSGLVWEIFACATQTGGRTMHVDTLALSIVAGQLTIQFVRRLHI